MSGSPSMNSVTERRNKTLTDMVRNMICHSNLPESLWGEALKTAAYILNRVPSLKHFHVWGCSTEARPYKPNERKLDSRIVSNYFIGYFERSRGYKFFDPKLKTIFDTGTTTFFEDIEFGGEE